MKKRFWWVLFPLIFLISCCTPINEATTPIPTRTPLSPSPTFTMVSPEDRAKTLEVKQTELAGTLEAFRSDQPIPTTDPRSDFEKCVQSGRGVRYVIGANNVSGVSLTWQNDTGGTNQGEYSTPFCLPLDNFSEGDFLYISAQIIHPTNNAGNITCRIYDGNNILSQAEASGFASIATCSASKK